MKQVKMWVSKVMHSWAENGKERLVTTSKCTHASVGIYLQKASLKSVGLLSREKAMVISGEDHLRCKGIAGTWSRKAPEKERRLKEREDRRHSLEKKKGKREEIIEETETEIVNYLRKCRWQSTKWEITAVGKNRWQFISISKWKQK